MSLEEYAAQTKNISLSLDGLRVLVVEAHPDTKVLFTLVFEESGAEVFAVDSVQEALTAIQQVQPHVLVSDIKLLGEDGYSLIRQIRSLNDERTRHIPAIAVTGLAREDDRTEALSAGFQQHLAKPVDLDNLLTLIAALAEPFLERSLFSPS